MSTTVATAIGVLAGLFGAGGIVTFALRYNREDADSLVGTMRAVSAELRVELERLTTQRDELLTRVDDLHLELAAQGRQIALLRHELASHGLIAPTAPGGAS